MKRALFSFSVLAMFLAHTLAYASTSLCSFYARPTYIDMVYKKIGDFDGSQLEGEYGPKTRFRQLLSAYTEHYKPPLFPDDKPFREAEALSVEYASYLEAAHTFQTFHYAQALEKFERILEDLRSRPAAMSTWVQEASTYMVARCLLALSQLNWDGYPESLKKINQATLAKAEKAYAYYLKVYPRGLYATSAHHIKRRIYYFSGRQDALDQALREATKEAVIPDPRLFDELSAHFHGTVESAKDAPLLIAYSWLTNKQPPTLEDIQNLQTRAKDFSPYPGLRQYLRALGFYKMQRYDLLLKETPEEDVKNNVLSLSTQSLRAYAFKARGSLEKAAVALEKMQRVAPQDNIEREIAFIKLEQNKGLWLYTNDSPLRGERVLRTIAQFGLSDRALEEGLKQKNILALKRGYLLEELARRYLLSGRFDKLHRLFQREPEMGIFSPLKYTSALLNKDPNNAQALLWAGGFMYRQYITPTSFFGGYILNSHTISPLEELLPRCGHLCSNLEKRRKNYRPPLIYFQRAAAIERGKGHLSEIEAQSLHYLVKCFRGPEFEMRCTWGTQQDPLQSKMWFQRLHTVYSHSIWTKKTPYYYKTG